MKILRINSRNVIPQRYLEVIAKTNVNMGMILGEQDRTADAMKVFEEVVRRFGGSEVLAILEQVALALSNKANALIRLNREEDALCIYSEIADRFGTTEHSVLRNIAGDALISKGELELRVGRNDAALETATRSLSLPNLDSPGNTG